MKRTVFIVAGLLSAWLTRAEVIENDTYPQSALILIDCDLDGTPEDVLDLQGEMHVLITRTVDKAGGAHLTVHLQPLNMWAVGQITGDTYRAVGLTCWGDTLKGDHLSFTLVNNFYVIGQRSGIKYLVHATSHITVVDGESVVSVDAADAKCQ